MIFGQLLTGSNYDDEEERIISGRNGLGVKLTNIFSETFTVKGCDPKNGKILEQTWTNNMRNTEGPKIKSTKLKKGYTEVSWIPQFKHFKLKSYTSNVVKHYTRYVIDAAILSGINVYLNDELLNIKTLQDYSSLYEQLTDERYVKADVAEEVEAIQKAIEDFKSEYKYKIIQGGFTLSEISIVKVLDEEVTIEEDSRSIDGKQQDYDKVDVEFRLKAEYKDEDGSVEVEYWDVDMDYDDNCC